MLEEFLSEVECTKSIYDLIACCCDFIYKHVPNEELFIAQYIDGILEREDGVNPNGKKLLLFSDNIIEAFIQQMEDSPHTNYPKWKALLIRMVGDIQLTEYLGAKENLATIPYIILASIDAVLPSYPAYLKSKSGPLGNFDDYDTLVYPADANTIISNAARELEFRGKVHTSKLKECLQSVRIVPKKDLPHHSGIPVIKPLQHTKGKKNNGAAKEKFSVAFIPYSIEQEFDFCQGQGSALTVKYHKGNEENLKKRCEALLDQALASQANIVILPEYIVNKKMLQIMKSFLRRKTQDSPRSLDHLMMVMAGSTWDESNNNILYMLDRFGNELGRYYKYSPFTERADSAKTLGAFKICEALQNPGKECTLINIDGIGHILPAICRDVINEEYTARLSELFHPALVMVPAWSPSVQSFRERFESLANKFHISTFLFNSCQPVEKRPGNFTCICTPKKTGSIIEGNFVMMNTNLECIEGCKERGCVFLINADYGIEKVKNGEIINWEQKFY